MLRDQWGREVPEPSRWAMIANKALMALAYTDERRGFVPMGNELMWRCLEAKRDYVRMAEQAEADEPMSDVDFVDMCFEGFERLLGIKP